MRLCDADVRKLLPDHIGGDPQFSAAGGAVNGQLLDIAHAIPGLLIYSRLGRQDASTFLPPFRCLAGWRGPLPDLPEEILDLLAWQFHVDGYEQAPDYEGKRRLVLASIPLHRRKGTSWSVRSALEAAFGMPVEIPEWFTYGGVPYFFRVAIDVSGQFWGMDYADRAWRLIFEYKNVRSWLEYLITRAVSPADRCRGSGIAVLDRVKTCLFFIQQPLLPVGRFMGASLRSLARSWQRLWFVPRPARLSSRPAMCVSGITRSAMALAPGRAQAFERSNYA